MLKIQHTLCPKCNKMVPRAVGICILCGEVTEQAAVPVEQPSTQKVAALYRPGSLIRTPHKILLLVE